jgi:hypothetical protein
MQHLGLMILQKQPPFIAVRPLDAAYRVHTLTDCPTAHTQIDYPLAAGYPKELACTKFYLSLTSIMHNQISKSP